MNDLNDMIKKVIPNVHIESFICQGGQKTVYKAKHDVYGDIVIKLVNCNNKHFLERTYREIEVYSQLTSSLFAKLYDKQCITTNNQYWICIMEEYIDGKTLRDELNTLKQNPIPIIKINNIISCLLNALVEIEKKQLVHRDIKPENIMLEKERIVLIDFGLARHLDLTSLTETYAPIGPQTPGYGAPEQIRNLKRQISIRTDLFSIGVVFFELLTGKNPFKDGCKTVGEVFERILNEDIRISGFSDSICNFINQCLQKVPHRRPSNAKVALKMFNSIIWEE